MEKPPSGALEPHPDKDGFTKFVILIVKLCKY